jgi:uncharacterized repeat protein (TIGR03803 family)
MISLRVSSLSAASGLACVRLVSLLALESALLTLCAQSPVIYNFTGSTSDGSNPHCAPLIDGSGRLFGTTVYGGASGDGTVYKLTPGGGGSWTETLLHSFAGHPGDGAEPDGDLLMVSSNLYGTTAIGGSSNAGTVYEMKNSSGTWSESVLYNFAGGTGDGGGPFSAVIVSGGVLYGTTFYGGSNLDGTVFSLTPPSPWTEAILYNFGASASDGQNPHSALLDAGSGVYYGTTYNGGSDSSGTVYELKDSSGTWTETVIYTFTGGSDGSNPHPAVIMDSSGALYGTTVFGGANSKGTVYKLTPGGGGSWTESVLYSFGASSSDAAIPLAGVVFGSTQSVLYGATTKGGGSSGCSYGCGTVYKLTLSGGTWSESILYAFTGYANSDGEDPYSDITYSGGWIYGTTYSGGTSANCSDTNGCGTVYALQP